MNVRLLKRIKKHILDEPRRFNMGTWCQSGESGARGLAMITGESIIYPKCGTVACIAGWANVLTGASPRYVQSSHRAMSKLGIDYDWPLFYVAGWPKKFQEPYAKAISPLRRAKVAAARIEHFIQTGKMNDRPKNPAAVALGSMTSPKKAKAARENGKLGGRPKGNAHQRRLQRRKTTQTKIK